MTRAAAARPDSRARIVGAAQAEFAARGFDGANMDRIARAARLNKAMIYYYFRSKAALYNTVFREFIAAALERTTAVADADQPPADRIREFVAAVAAEARARPHFPPMWLREIASGARHLDQAVLDLVVQIPITLGRIVADGVAAGVFRPVHPLLLHFGIVGPLVLFHTVGPLVDASRPRRGRPRADVGGARLGPLPPIEPEAMVEQIVQATLATLAPDRPAARPGPLIQGRRS